MRQMPVHPAPFPAALLQSVTRPLRQKALPSPMRRLVRMGADLAGRAQPDAARASDFFPPAGKSVPHTTTHVRLESPAMPRAAHASLADSTVSTVRKVAHSDRFAP